MQKCKNKTSNNNHAIFYGERLLNPFFNKKINRDVKNNHIIRINNFKQTKENKNFILIKGKKEAKSSSNPRKENKKQITKINEHPQQKSGTKAKSQNILKKKICTKISSIAVKRKAYSSSNSKTKHLKFPLSYGNNNKKNNTHNDNDTISTVNCVRSLVMKKRLNFLTINTMKNNKNLITF